MALVSKMLFTSDCLHTATIFVIYQNYVQQNLKLDKFKISPGTELFEKALAVNEIKSSHTVVVTNRNSEDKKIIFFNIC